MVTRAVRWVKRSVEMCIRDSIKTYNARGNTYEALTAPQTVAAGKPLVKVKLGGGTFYFRPQNDVVLEAGTRYKYTVKAVSYTHLAKILKIWRICRDDLLSTPYFPCHYGILMKKGRKRDDISPVSYTHLDRPAWCYHGFRQNKAGKTCLHHLYRVRTRFAVRFGADAKIFLIESAEGYWRNEQHYQPFSIEDIICKTTLRDNDLHGKIYYSESYAMYGLSLIHI